MRVQTKRNITSSQQKLTAKRSNKCQSKSHGNADENHQEDMPCQSDVFNFAFK